MIIAAGIVVAAGRCFLAGSNDPGSLIRSWIAMSLVRGLFISSAISFELNDSGLRNVLIGALVANAGAAVVFYFASKAADQARQDILEATFGSESVPALIGKTVLEAKADLFASPLVLVVSRADATGGVTA